MSEDHLIPVLIDDSISSLKFFPSKDIDYLASGGWDSKIRLFEIKYQILSQNSSYDNVEIGSNQINVCKLESPILSIDWVGNSGAIVAGCINGSINYVDPQKNISNKIGQHNSGCRDVIYVHNYNVLITGGWDGKLNIWDLRSQNPILSYQFKNKIYTMSYANNLLVLGLSDLVMAYFNLQNLQSNNFKPDCFFLSHLKEQTKKVVVLNDGTGFVQASIEGRCAVKYLNPSIFPKINKETKCIENPNDYAFRCHREGKADICYIYTINDLCINPVYDSICTAGGEGKFIIWDIKEKSRLYERENFTDKCPLTASIYNYKGNLLAYASGYDWSKGASFANEYSRPKIFIHYLQNNHRKK